MNVSNMWGQWTFCTDAWPEQTGCCPLTGRVYSINPIGSAYNVAATKTIEDAERIVACVNACAGIPTYQLTDGNGKPVLLGEVIDSLRNDAAERPSAADYGELNEKYQKTVKDLDEVRQRYWCESAQKNNLINYIYAVLRDCGQDGYEAGRKIAMQRIKDWYAEGDE